MRGKCSVFIGLMAPALAGPPMAQPAAPAPVVQPLSADAQFAAFIRDFRATALAAGITPQTYDSSMTGLFRGPEIEALNLNQPEFSKPIWNYLDSSVSDKR